MKWTAGLIVAGLLLFGASFGHPFHFDDALITGDSNVTNPARWAHFFNPLHLRQLTFFSFYLNHLAGGLNPAGFHVVNVALHVANAVLLFWLLRRFVQERIAVVAAAIFLVHPIQTEPVVYVYQRSALLACFFSLLALLALVRGRYGWAALSFVLAFEGKESALAVPLAVALLWFRRNWRELPSYSLPNFERVYPEKENSIGRAPSPFGRRWRALSRRERVSPIVSNSSTKAGRPRLRRLGGELSWRWLGLLLPIAAGVLALALLLEDKTVGVNSGVSPFRYLLTQTRVVYTYLRLLVFPYPQSLEYDFQNAGGILTAAGVILMLLAGWFWRSLSVLAFFILLAPTSSIIPSADAAFEHRLYLPMLAFALFAAYAISKAPRRAWIAAAVLCILSVLTLRRERVWSSDVTLWEDAARHAPGKARVWFNLGGAYLNSQPDKARAAFLRALELQPHIPEALYDLGVIEQGKKNWSAALSYYERALAQNPEYWPALNNIGNTLFTMGQRERSLEFFERTLRLNPDYWPAQYNIAIVHFMSGRYSEAIPRLRTVLDWRPDFREARYLLATTLTQSGDRGSADQEWKKLGEMKAAESRHTPTMILAPSRP